MLYFILFFSRVLCHYVSCQTLFIAWMCSLCARDQQSSISLASFVVLYEAVVDLVFAPKNELFPVHVALATIFQASFRNSGFKVFVNLPVAVKPLYNVAFRKTSCFKRNNTMQLINHVLKHWNCLFYPTSHSLSFTLLFIEARLLITFCLTAQLLWYHYRIYPVCFGYNLSI